MHGAGRDRRASSCYISSAAGLNVSYILSASTPKSVFSSPPSIHLKSANQHWDSSRGEHRTQKEIGEKKSITSTSECSHRSRGDKNALPRTHKLSVFAVCKISYPDCTTVECHIFFSLRTILVVTKSCGIFDYD